MVRFFVLFTLTAVSGVAMAAGRAAADVATYDNRADFEADLGTPFVTETFGSVNLGSGLAIVTNGGGGVDAAGGFYYDDLSVALGQSVAFSFAAPIFGFGGDFDFSPGETGTGLILTVLDANGELLFDAEFGPEPSPLFFGLVSDTAIGSFNLRAGNGEGDNFEQFTLDNFTFGPASDAPPAVPAPPALALALVGVAVLAPRLRGRRPAQV